MTLFRFGQRTVSIDSAIGMMKLRPEMAAVPLRPASLRSSLDKIGESLVFDVKGETIEKEHPEFAAIMKEYSEGILLYQVEQEQVWNRITVTDSALRAYHEIHNADFTFPDRVDISFVRVANDSIASGIRKRLDGGATMEMIAREDSLRVHAPTSYHGPFKAKSSKLGKTTLDRLAIIAKEVTADPSLRISLIAYYDTTKKPATTEKLAKERVATLRSYLAKKYGIAETRINTTQRIPGKSLADSTRKAMFARADMEIAGRRPVVFGGVENSVLPVDADERTQLANALPPGGYTQPLQYEGMTYVVRLNKKDPSRIKTFEEAGTEVSSAYQEAESLRLEKEWLDSLRARYPVTENSEALKGAFAPLQ
jgi:peptidyl-prolyl cis-trans isomerase SurA